MFSTMQKTGAGLLAAWLASTPAMAQERKTYLDKPIDGANVKYGFETPGGGVLASIGATEPGFRITVYCPPVQDSPDRPQCFKLDEKGSSNDYLGNIHIGGSMDSAGHRFDIDGNPELGEGKVSCPGDVELPLTRFNRLARFQQQIEHGQVRFNFLPDAYPTRASNPGFADPKVYTTADGSYLVLQHNMNNELPYERADTAIRQNKILFGTPRHMALQTIFAKRGLTIEGEFGTLVEDNALARKPAMLNGQELSLIDPPATNAVLDTLGVKAEVADFITPCPKPF